MEEITNHESQIAPGLIVPSHGLPLLDRIKHRRELLTDASQYTFQGFLQKIVFDPAGMDLPIEHWEGKVVCPNMLQWLEEDPTLCPRLAISKDEQDLLIIGPLPQPSDLCGDVNDRSQYEPTKLPGWEVRGGMRPKLWPQRYMDRTRLFLGEWLVIQPVSQILFYPRAGGQFGMIRPGAGPDGTQMAFLVDPKAKEGHFIGGSLYVDMRIHSPV
jgi:hypothetical protein